MWIVPRLAGCNSPLAMALVVALDDAELIAIVEQLYRHYDEWLTP